MEIGINTYFMSYRGEEKDYEYHKRTNTGYFSTIFPKTAKQSQRLAEINIINF